MITIAFLPVIHPTKPRTSYITRDFIERVVINAAACMDDQSGGRAVFEFVVFDWYRLEMSAEEFEALDDNLGPVAKPLLERHHKVDLDQFEKLALIVDEENGGGVWLGSYLYLSARGLTPDLLTHELGHLFGAGHGWGDAPRGPVEYMDPFTAMGGRGAPWTFAHPDFDFRPRLGQQGWRYCERCRGLFHNGPAPRGVCPADEIPGSERGHTTPSGGRDYLLRHDIPDTGGQNQWRLCRKCQLLFFAGAAGPVVCPAGGDHNPTSGGFDYVLAHGVPTGPEQTAWRRCGKCFVIFWNGETEQGRCAAGGSHRPANGGLDYVLPNNVPAHNTAGPGLNAPDLLHIGWLSATRHGIDMGPALRARPGETTVGLRALRGAPRFDTGPAQTLLAYADDLLPDRRIVIEYRARDGWDRGLPDETDWVLVHLTSVIAPHVSQLLVAALPVEGDATVFVREAHLTISVVFHNPATRAVVLRVRSHAWPAFGELTRRVTVPERTDVTPAIATDNDIVYLAWTGSDGFVHIGISFDSGATFAVRFVTEARTARAPALVGDAGPFVAWTRPDQRLAVARIDTVRRTLVDTVVLPEKSPHGPALTAHAGLMFLAWTDVGRNVNAVLSRDLGKTWPEKFRFTHESDSRPAILSHAAGRLYLAWTDLATDRFAIARVHLEDSTDARPGVHFFASPGLVDRVNLGEFSRHAPALASRERQIYLAFTDAEGAQLEIAGPTGDHHGHGSRTYLETSDDGPSLANYKRELMMAWRARGTNEITIARLQPIHRLIDDFWTGPVVFGVRPLLTETRVQPGTMLGGSRQLRVRNPDSEAEARLTLLFGSLQFDLMDPRVAAELEINYGPQDPESPGLGLNLTDGGHSRFRITIEEIQGRGVDVFVRIYTPGRVRMANTFMTSPGQVDFLFEDFGTPGDLDLTDVGHLSFVFRTRTRDGDDSPQQLIVTSIETTS